MKNIIKNIKFMYNLAVSKLSESGDFLNYIAVELIDFAHNIIKDEECSALIINFLN